MQITDSMLRTFGILALWKQMCHYSFLTAQGVLTGKYMTVSNYPLELQINGKYMEV